MAGSIRQVNEAFTPERDKNFAINQLIKKFSDLEASVTALQTISFDLVGGSGSIGGAILDNELCNTVAFGNPAASPYAGLTNNFAKGDLVWGEDFSVSVLGRRATWPAGSIIEWSWPSSGGVGIGGFAYGYPIINYGGSNYVVNSPYGIAGAWPMKINDLGALTVAYDLGLGGNTDGYDILLDTFVTTSPSSVDGSYVAEISFFPYCNPDLPLIGSTVHTFSFGECLIGSQGLPQGLQILVQPTSGAGTVHRSILSGIIDLKEIYQYLVATGVGGLTGDEYVRGLQFGPETQVPAVFNSAPYSGFLRFNQLNYVWS